MKNGFTLVELSIVLVIIGLLVGGVLIGQSLIDSAKISSQIRQIQQFDIAVSQFKNRFRNIPGDSPLFVADGDGADADSGRGDGNGFLQNKNGIQQFCQIALYIGECDEFWKQLGETGMIEGSYSNDYSAGIIPDVGAPRGVYNNVNVLPYHIIGVANIRDDRNYFILQGNSNLSLPETSGGEAIAPVDAMAMDAKIDDGAAITGIVRAINAPILGGGGSFGACIDTNEYDIDNAERACSPLFEMLSLAE